MDSFSAKVSSADAVTEENISFINGNCTNATTGRGTCTYDTGIFSVTPNCLLTGDNGEIVYIVTQSSSAITYETRNSAGVAVNYAVNISCQKQGADFVASRTIVGSFAEVVTSPGISKPKVCYYQFGGASNTLACTASPCSKYVDTCSSGTVPTRAGVGLYAFDISAGTFANNSFLNCFCSATGGSIECAGVGIATSNSSGGASLAPRTFTNAGAASDQYPTITCIGSAP